MLESTKAWTLVAALAVGMTAGPAYSQGAFEDYRRAQTMLGLQPDPIAFDGKVEPNWIAGEESFWFLRQTPTGRRFVAVDIARRQKAPAFDHERVAAALTASVGRAIRPDRLPFDSFRFDAGRQRIRFTMNQAPWSCHLATNACREEERLPSRNASAQFFAGFGLGAGLKDNMAVSSPDGKWEVLLRDYNLVLRSTESKQEVQLTVDGSAGNDYSFYPSSPELQLRLGESGTQIPPSAHWSPDSSRFVAFRLDARNSPRLTLVQSARGPNSFPFAYSYHAPVAGNANAAKVVPFLFDVAQNKGMPVETEPLPWLWTEAGPFRPVWSRDGSRIWFVDFTRGYRQVRLKEIDAKTAKTRTIVSDTGARPLNYPLQFFNWRLLDTGEVVWLSERDGWQHLYLYRSNSAALERQLTQGSWAVREIVRVARNPDRVYFYGSGREPSRDPYLNHLYSIEVKGGEPRLLTPEPGDHTVAFSPSGDYFVDCYSTVSKPWISVIRSAKDGSVVMEVETAEMEPLEKLGWTPPEPVELLAADGKTKLYGVVFRPSHFKADKKYPVIESVYAYPSSVGTPKNFNLRRASSTTGAPGSQAMAELGFIVVTLDGRGTGQRSSAFREVIYDEDWPDRSWDDHVEGLRQLARRYPQMDLDRVGIFGHSAGGYNVVNAMLVRPDFYKVGVASGGAHARETALAWSVEPWTGFPPNWRVFGHSNIELAGRLTGKLLLAHGELDDNVHPSSTLKLVDALVAANKDFELLVLPGQRHSLGSNRYMIRKRWDFFVRHLLGVDPPREFDLRQ